VNDRWRRAMGRKIGRRCPQQRQRFCGRRGPEEYPAKKIETIFDLMAQFLPDTASTNRTPRPAVMHRLAYHTARFETPIQ